MTQLAIRKAERKPIAPGEKYGSLTVMEPAGRVGSENRVAWKCACVCGNPVVAIGKDLRRGHTTSCGCMRRFNRLKHGHTKGHKDSKIYYTWHSMLARCQNPATDSYPLYGGRGIKVCERWTNFEVFLADMGGPPSAAHSLDRIDPNADYSPENCRWASVREQANNKRSNRLISFNGVTQTIALWAEQTGINYMTLYTRLFKHKWSAERALTEAIGPQGVKK